MQFYVNDTCVIDEMSTFSLYDVKGPYSLVFKVK